MPFNFDDVVLAQGEIQDRDDREWCLMIGCAAASSARHGTSTQRNDLGRKAPQDFQAGIRTTDDLFALQEVLEILGAMVSQKLDELIPSEE